MMKLTPANLFNGIALAGIAAVIGTVTIYDAASPGIDPVTTASIAPSGPSTREANRFMVVDHTANQTCIFALHRAKGYDVHRIEPAKTCEALSRRLSDARAWQEMPNGHVTITDRAGVPILKLGPSDGFAYEVVEPSTLAMSLEAF